ncbi:thrombospondin-1-like [Ruditapes philippinarum]|uniref:thrombospondin-1-like n=1 Tax=Ruditapes philippinarum TaxID=129788 RepID=UPI00295B2F8F|nr:thrombospondin-1-like [Ruditapes philippinarum]
MITYRSYNFALVVFIFSMGTRHVDCLECYSCTNIFNKDNCTHTAKCGSGQLCYQDLSDIGQSPAYHLGCIDKHKCSTTNSGGSGALQLVGRDLQKRQTESCHECCSTDNCNKHLCGHFKPSSCIDNENIDCGFLNTVTNICADIHHAKTICPRFCDLCSLVDGMWSDWTAWSACDVTCDNGTQSRTRTCSNPPPSNGGLNCTGHTRDYKSCHKQLCPVQQVVVGIVAIVEAHLKFCQYDTVELQPYDTQICQYSFAVQQHVGACSSLSGVPGLYEAPDVNTGGSGTRSPAAIVSSLVATH